MKQRFARYCYSTLLASATFLTVGLGALSAKAQEMYNPLPLVSGEEIADLLSQKDIPTGDGGFSRDYKVRLEQGDNVAIDLLSDEFDPMVILIATDGATVAENDDGPDGTTNSLLFARITDAGDYIVRVRAFGETGGGNFRLKVTRLKPI
ncbi:PPC domain-containing protein [Spirulina sp. 06S082]|uniref:PPC domain-containing protein n=1 Tax=Spirulina sp. 06S082 TaxID=3110248 RepID=UPI002B1FF1C8|nr:PPC domain-containing protein [Spirulina sp. 06S082]MEA5471279.1 PPC domain-containing protein [Spirulina sp. 06S082]